MKNLVSIFAGHDANISFWNAETMASDETARSTDKSRCHLD